MLRALPLVGSTSRPLVASRRVPRSIARVSPRRLARRRTLLSAKTVLDPTLVESDVTSDDSESESEIEHDPLTTQQVKTLITTLCEDTNIAQLHLQLGSYKVKIQRSVHTHSDALVDPLSAAPAAGSVEDSFSEEEAMASIDESLMLIDSPKVGFFRLGVFNKNGKKVGKGPVPGDQVKAGQMLCAIEQLGTFTPISSPQPGEVLAFPFSDGEPVAYQDAVVEFAPYFGGHIIGDRKYA